MLEPRLVYIKCQKHPVSVISEEQQMIMKRQIDARAQQLRKQWGEFDEPIIIRKPELVKCKNEMSQYYKKWSAAFSNNFKYSTFIKKISKIFM